MILPLVLTNFSSSSKRDSHYEYLQDIPSHDPDSSNDGPRSQDLPRPLFQFFHELEMNTNVTFDQLFHFWTVRTSVLGDRNTLLH